VLSANRELSTRGIAEALARLEPDPVPFVVCGIRPYGVALRLGRPIVEVESAAAAARALLDGRCIVLSRRQWQTIEALPEIERLAPARERVRFRHKEFEVACPPGLAQR
jgi:hypothetical protein